ncbi:MAG: hypothetical protein K2L00_01610, partial [Muribaculaceae bacterium]|nr:hypothetical protein [Muribaculaceae bacterium]
MNTRAKSILTMAASALTLLASQSLAATAPAHAPADTVNQQLMKSVNELSKTASNLSEAILKLIDSKGSSPAIDNISENTDTIITTTAITENGIF